MQIINLPKKYWGLAHLENHGWVFRTSWRSNVGVDLVGKTVSKSDGLKAKNWGHPGENVKVAKLMGSKGIVLISRSPGIWTEFDSGIKTISQVCMSADELTFGVLGNRVFKIFDV